MLVDVAGRERGDDAGADQPAEDLVVDLVGKARREDLAEVDGDVSGGVNLRGLEVSVRTERGGRR